MLERLKQLCNAFYVRENTDRYVTSGTRPAPSLEDIQADLTCLPVLIGIASHLAWTQRGRHRDWLAGMADSTACGTASDAAGW